ncbi:hypothetical protein [Acidipropionibacterium acidipropionici]|uniref:hypothetical protein n=1 Tax=Acidipropionibacterium acidipropionici TaxID=1748 RepID=UPI00110B2D7A|nr:hypothetical protein [Acidipropionibacterium acidipropionici]QCV94315.1 hypothetical protein FEZ30_02700 [Acidipropionibacterium acidipropionici]
MNDFTASLRRAELAADTLDAAVDDLNVTGPDPIRYRQARALRRRLNRASAKLTGAMDRLHPGHDGRGPQHTRGGQRQGPTHHMAGEATQTALGARVRGPWIDGPGFTPDLPGFTINHE